ncbi:hypothetical protein C5E04_05075 [Pectobacterium parmentieri]|nr:hypothetical protein C5E04_05075 [Pectobacterium parmentieri]
MGVNRLSQLSATLDCFTVLHTIKDQSEVCPVSGRGTFNPLSTPLQNGIRFFQHPLPAPSTACLATHLPHCGEDTGLPSSVLTTRIT